MDTGARAERPAFALTAQAACMDAAAQYRRLPHAVGGLVAVMAVSLLLFL